MLEGVDIFFIIEMMTITVMVIELFLLREVEINFDEIPSFEGLVVFLVNFVMEVVPQPLYEFEVVLVFDFS